MKGNLGGGGGGEVSGYSDCDMNDYAVMWSGVDICTYDIVYYGIVEGQCGIVMCFEGLV